MSDVVLATHGLHKSFGALKATDNVSIDLRAGEIHAIIGPEWRGKIDAHFPNLRHVGAGRRPH